MQYTDYANQASSEKITLAILDASRRLMGWELHSGSVYKLTGFDVAVIGGITDSGSDYTEVGSLGSITSSTYFNDRENQTLFIQTVSNDNPNGRFLVLTEKLHFANVSIALPHDLNTGYEVEFQPMIASTSQFGVEIDTINQASEAIEGSGSLTLHNDHEFWPANYEAMIFENQSVLIYSYSRDLEPSEAKLIFNGKVEKKSYNDKTITLSLKDALSELRAPLSLGAISDLGLRTGSDLDQARQRMILGRVFGHIPVNVDQVLEGYPLTGTISATYESATITGSGTAFLAELSPDDELILAGERYTVATVTSNTSLTLTENYSLPAGLSGVSVEVLPDKPKRYINRVWHVAGHPLREPVTAVSGGSTVAMLFVDDATDIFEGDVLRVGPISTGENVTVASRVGKSIVYLSSSLGTIPSIGTLVTRPAIQNVRINDVPLTYYDDYTFNAETATLTLRTTAEANASPIRNLVQSLTFTNGSRTVTGTGFKNSLQVGYMVGVSSSADFREILSIESDTSLTLRTTWTSATVTAGGRYKSLVFNPSEHTLSLDVLGKTEDGETNGPLLKTGPRTVKALLGDLGLADSVDEESFDRAEELAYQNIGLVFPTKFNDKDTPTYRDIINRINRSVFGSLIQNGSFKFSYEVLQPSKPTVAQVFREEDLLQYSLSSTAENMIKTAIVTYNPKEYDYLTGQASIRTKDKTSDNATYLLRTTREKTFTTYLVDEQDAGIASKRWAFLLSYASSRLSFTTKLQAMELEVGDIIEVEHRKFFARMGTETKRKLFLVESIKKSGSLVQIEAVDLSNAFNRVACYNEYSEAFQDATETEKLYGGYYTDEYGLIDNSNHGINLYW